MPLRPCLLAACLLTALAAAAQTTPPLTTRIAGSGFDEVSHGSVNTWTDPGGDWRVSQGEARIEPAYGRGSGPALRLMGGDTSVIEWAPALGDAAAAELTLWAQRWTRQDPFRFRVEARIGGDWRVLLTGDDTVPVGKYQRFTVPWPDGRVQRLRLVCTSPPGKGVLIDDLSIDRALPMRIASVTAEQRATPVLIGSAFSPLMRISVEAPGNREPLGIRRIAVTLDGTTRPQDIEQLEIRYTAGTREPSFRDPDRLFEESLPLGEPIEPGDELVFEGDVELVNGLNTFWLTAKLNPDADQSSVVDATLREVVTADGTRHTPAVSDPPGAKRIGVALRNTGQDGVAAHRIPGLVTTNTGTLIAVYDLRHGGWGDLPGNIDVGMSRSTDGERTWEPSRVILDMGDDPRWSGDGVGDPCVLVDRVTNTIWVAGFWSHGDRGFHGSGPGLSPEETAQLVLVRSDDDGRTWSDPINITRQVKDPAWRLLFQGPGRGITTRDGVLVFPAQFVDAHGVPHATVMVSRDRGRSWEVGTGARPDTTEAQVVELADGSLMLNMRDNRGGSRAVAVTDDFGKSWRPHPSSRSALPEPICQASLIATPPATGAGPDWLVFSNPAVHEKPRRNMTIKGSVDQGLSWPASHQLLIDEGQSAGYSCLTRIDERTLGILYEGSLANLVFMRVPVADVFPEAR